MKQKQESFRKGKKGQEKKCNERDNKKVKV